MTTKSGETYGFDALVQVDPYILLHPSVAGRSYDVRIAGQPMTLTLPLEGLGSQPLPRPLPGRRFPDPPLAAGFASEAELRLASVLSIPDEVLAIDLLRLKGNDREIVEAEGTLVRTLNADALLKTPRMFGKWLDTVRDWLAAWSGNPRDPVELRLGPRVRVASEDRPDNGALTVGGNTPTLMFGGDQPSTPLEWEAAITAASLERDLPLARRLLAEANSHASRSEYRHAVISACSAAEVALAETAQAHLQGAAHTDDQVSEILKNLSGLMELYRLNASHERLNVSFGRMLDQVSKPRNLAAHRGDIPTDESARRAIGTVQVLLELAPLPEPSSFLPS